MSNKTVFFGIMTGDLFGNEPTDGIDDEASVEKYGEMCIKAIAEGFAKHGEQVHVEWESQDVGGCIPWGLKTRVDGDTDHEDIEFVDSIIGDVWASWNWIIEA